MSPSCTCDPLHAAASGLTRLWAHRQGLVVELEYIAESEEGGRETRTAQTFAAHAWVVCELLPLALQAMTGPQVQFLYVCLDTREPHGWRLEVADDTGVTPGQAHDVSTLDPLAWQPLAARLAALGIPWSLQAAPVEGRLLVMRLQTSSA